MSAQPTLILIAEPASIRHDAGEDGALRYFGSLAYMVARARGSGLPLLVVCDEHDAKAVRGYLPEERILRVRFRAHSTADQFAEALVAGVQADANASGWLTLPCSIPMIKVETLQKVANGLSSHPVAYAEHRQQQGYPIGFSSELFSELIQISSFRDMERVIVRYPAKRVEVDDPGALLIAASLQRDHTYIGQDTPAAGHIHQRP